jgi:hypothetical protein
MDRETTRKGSKEESFILSTLTSIFPDITKTSNSGATFSDGDLAALNYHIEIKATAKASFSLKKSLLESSQKKADAMEKKLLWINLFTKPGERFRKENIYVTMSLSTLEEDNTQHVELLEAAIRKHAQAKGHDRCWENDLELYEVIGLKPENPGLPCKEDFLKKCEEYYKEQMLYGINKSND